jgi:NADH:ubiquinone reductase (H+-translocating)
MGLKDGSKFPKIVIIVIVGGGFGGLQVAKKLEDIPVEVLMIDKKNEIVN